MNYYNEIDSGAAAWMRELIKYKRIPAGEVDERSIWDVRPGDLRGFTQCHFFAGIGGWALALKLAGFPADREVWTGSCPCQPFSSAGKGAGVTDERHLWPAWFHLIRECRPDLIFGEQVSAAIGHGWLDLVQDDLAGEGYACGPIVLPACSVGAPHVRQRLWFVAHSASARAMREPDNIHDAAQGSERGHLHEPIGAGGVSGELADSLLPGRPERGAESGNGSVAGSSESYWSNAVWLPCRDGKSRAVEPAPERLAPGLSDSLGFVCDESGQSFVSPLIQKAKARVLRLKGYGNSIVPQVAAEVIKAWVSIERDASSEEGK